MNIGLNMIVRNESARIIRCLTSALPYISSYVIVDTGSTDGTPDLIRNFFAEHKIPGELHTTPFKSFGQARNDALAKAWYFAKHNPAKPVYFLLMDADMELVVTDPKAFDNLTGPSYDIVQRAGTLAYHNRRLVRSDQEGIYRGATHEYLDIPSAGTIADAYFIDHADGANRKDKFVRDIALLLEDLRDDPENGRSWFYLAQSYRDAGEFAKAAECYRKRAEMGGWDEEAWNARVNYAHCLKDLNDHGGFILNLLTAYNMRPSRAEPLYDLAKYFREKGDNRSSLLFSEKGVTIPLPPDHLFVNEHVYKNGMLEELSIAAFYDPEKRAMGAAVCNLLALKKDAPEQTRELARYNLYHYLQPITTVMPSFTAKRLEILDGHPHGYVLMNPSIATVGGELYTVIRTVNYTMDEHGRYLIKGTDGEANATNPIHTRNFLARVQDDLSLTEIREILPPTDQPAPAWDLVIGFEDMRIFDWMGDMWFSATMREMNASGYCEQVLGRISHRVTLPRVTGLRRLTPAPTQHEKNWMPRSQGAQLDFVYRLGQFIDTDRKVTYTTKNKLAIDHISGGSQLIPFNSGWLALVHEARFIPGTQRRYYFHRFVFWDCDSILRQVSAPFVFHAKQIEFAAGLAAHPDGKRLVISYGVRDCEAWLATVDTSDVMEFLNV